MQTDNIIEVECRTLVAQHRLVFAHNMINILGRKGTLLMVTSVALSNYENLH